MPESGFIPKEDISHARPTITNWKNQLKAIVNGYEAHGATIPEAVQKDAVQNGWDARVDKKHGKNWSMTFELKKGRSGIEYFCMTDSGTTGLTGRVLGREDLEKDLPPEERWGRFENVAFTKTPEEEAIGARGRGKFIFVGASQVHTIIYDTLRADGVYRFGFRTIESTDSPIDCFDGDQGREKLKEYTKGDLELIDHIGARVIIVKPISELVDAIESEEFLRFIEVTWWEIINKGAQIHVITKKGKKTAKIPTEFKLVDRDTPSFKTRLINDKEISVGRNKFRIKHMHLIYHSAGKVPEDIRGLSIQRSGMKVTSSPFKYVPKDISDSFYGYVSFEKDLDKAMQEAEGPEHYSFASSNPVYKIVKRTLEDELGAFAREKLNIGVSPEEKRKEMQSSAEREAVYAMNRILKSLGITGPEIMPPITPVPPIPPTPTKPLCLVLSDFEFPRKIRRVNYGERLKGARAIAVNDTNKKVEVTVRIYIVKGDKQIGPHLYEKNIEIESKTRLDIYTVDLGVTKEQFPFSGKYSLRASMLAIKAEGYKKEEKISTPAKTFYVEEDPPEKGVFEKCEGLAYPDDNLLMGEAVPGEEGAYIFQYNTAHPAYEVYGQEEDLKDYLVRIMADEVPRIIIRSPDQKVFSKETMDDSEALSREISALQGKIMYSHFSS